MSDRRGFLRQLVSLPLIGGGVTLIGQPTAVAEPVTADLMEVYKNWLADEMSDLCAEMAIHPVHIERYGCSDASERSWKIRRTCIPGCGGQPSYWHTDTIGGGAGNPSTRAALVLSAVGYEWRNCTGVVK